MGALNGIHVGKLTNKTLLRRGAYLKGGLIGRRALKLDHYFMPTLPNNLGVSSIQTESPGRDRVGVS